MHEKLYDLLAALSKGLANKQKKKLRMLIIKHQDIFDFDRKGKTNIVRPKINSCAERHIGQPDIGYAGGG